MKTKSFTIHTELLDGSLEGARNIYMGSNSTCHLYVIPRDRISLADTLADISGQPAFYILVGQETDGKPKAYIGQTTDFANRKNDHKQKKDWWDTALVFVSDNHKIYGDDVRFLEYLGIQAAQEAESYELLNGANPKKPNIAPFRVNDMEVFFRDIELLARFYGCSVFEPLVAVPSSQPSNRHLFYAKSAKRQANGIGYYREDEGDFVLCQGSVFAVDTVPSYKNVDARIQLIFDHCKINQDGHPVLLHDIPVGSPSTAASFILGRPSNGWDDWKDADGHPLASVYHH